MDNAAELKIGLRLEQPGVGHVPYLAGFEEEDPEFVERLTPEFYGDPEGWLAEIGDGGRLGWVALLPVAGTEEAEEPVGFVDLVPDSAENVAYMSFYVAVPYRGQGLGKRVVRQAAAKAGEAGVGELVAHPEGDNVPARRSLEQGGFTKVNTANGGTAYYTCDVGALP